MYRAKLSTGFKYKPRLGVWQDGKNNVFDPETFEAKSYRWWTYLCKIRGKVVFNAYPYSTTTQRHQKNMRDLLKHLKIKIDVEVSNRESLHQFSHSIIPLYESLLDLELFGHRKRRLNAKELNKDIQNLKQKIKILRKLGCKMSRKDIKTLRERLIAQDESRKAHAKKEREELKAKKQALKGQLESTDAVNFFSRELESTEPITFSLGE